MEIKINDTHTNTLNKCDSYFFTGAAYDTESSTIYSHTKDKRGNDITTVQDCFVYNLQFAIDETYYNFKTFTEFIEFLRKLVDYVKEISNKFEEKPKLVVWCANLSHEWAFMKNYISENFFITRLFAKTKRDVLLIELENCIQFRECIGLFGHSLKDISKNWCIKYKKLDGDLDYDLIRTGNTPLTDTEQAYCRNDVLCLTEMHSNIMNHYIRDDGVIYIPLTSTGFIRLQLKNSIENDIELSEKRFQMGRRWDKRTNTQLLKALNKKIFTTAKHWNLLRTYGYSGGLSGSNIDLVGKTLHNISCADITSDYPYQMLTKKFPAGKIYTCSGADFDNIKDKYHYFAIIHIDKMIATTNHATFSKHKVINLNEESFKNTFGEPQNMVILNGKILRAENVILIMNDIDYKTYNAAYNIKIKKIFKCFYFKSSQYLPLWLRQVIAKNYVVKSKLKADYSDTQEYKDAKRDTNSGYGCLACRPNDIFNSLDVDNLFTPEKEFTFNDLRKNTWLNPYWAFYITSYARQMLIQYIVKYPEAVAQYDTDSLYFKYKHPQGAQLMEELTDFNNNCIINNKRKLKNFEGAEWLETLGTWDFDKPYKRCLFLGAKKYIKETEKGIQTVIAGLPKTAIPEALKDDKIKNVFTECNPIELEDEIIISSEYTKKFASAYNDTKDIEYKEITDYQGRTTLQPVSSYHALIPIDFTLSVSLDYLKQIRQFQKVKQLQ